MCGTAEVSSNTGIFSYESFKNFSNSITHVQTAGFYLPFKIFVLCLTNHVYCASYLNSTKFEMFSTGCLQLIQWDN